MPNLRTKTWTTTTPAYVEDAQFWEDHLISDAVAAKAASSVQTVNSTAPDANGNVDVVALPAGGTVGQVLTKKSSTDGDADWENPASSGHTIEDEDGTTMTQQPTMQFVNADVTNDSVNSKTIVDCKGSKGDPGDAATITVGTVTTLPAGSNATVINSGTTSAAVFNFGIPKGADGTGAGDMLKADYDDDSTVINAGGIVDYVASQAYTLPTAASNVLGGVKVGTNLSIDASGVLSATDTNTDALHDLTDVNISLPSDGQALLYDSASSKWVNGNIESGSGGSIITVTAASSSLYGQTVTITDGTTTLTKTFSNSGEAVFEGVTLTGSLTITSTGATSYTLNVPYYGNYSATLSVFSATITITFPYTEGGTCTISDGDTTLTATESPMAFTIPNTGTWVATCTLDGQSKTQSFVITTDGQTESHTFEYGTINLTYANEFRGVTLTCSSGGTTISKVAPVGANSMVFYPPSTGEWIISGTYSGVPYSTSATIVSLSTSVSAILQTLPDGKTLTPTDDIQKWLSCAGITNKSYTTLAEVLADSTTLLALLSSDNANDYLVRSKSWATASGQVPTMTSDTTPSGTVIASGELSASQYNKWKAFNPNETKGWLNDADNPYAHTGNYVGYTFPSAVKMLAADITLLYYSNATVAKGKIQGYDGSIWTDVTDEVTITANSGNTPTRANFSKNIDTYESYRFILTADLSSNNTYGIRLQFYATTESAGLCDNSTAMTDIGANNYCANTLLADSTWCSAICNSTYFESVLNKKVPTMTGYTTPSGQVSQSSELDSASLGWYVFTDSGTYWHSTTTMPQWIYYHFTSRIKVYLATLKNGAGVGGPKTSKIQGSNNGTDWTDIDSFVDCPYSADTHKKVITPPSIDYEYYRLYITESNYSNAAVIERLQFYGR